jgi:hypothetical protein
LSNFQPRAISSCTTPSEIWQQFDLVQELFLPEVVGLRAKSDAIPRTITHLSKKKIRFQPVASRCGLIHAARQFFATFSISLLATAPVNRAGICSQGFYGTLVTWKPSLVTIAISGASRHAIWPVARSMSQCPSDNLPNVAVRKRLGWPEFSVDLSEAAAISRDRGIRRLCSRISNLPDFHIQGHRVASDWFGDC